MQEQIIAPDAHEQTRDAADDGKEQTFAKQLAHNAPARCPERETHCDFLGARRAASEQHVGEIQTRDEQDRPRHRHQQRADERDRSIIFRRGAEAEARWLLELQFARAFGIRWLNGSETLRQNRQARFCLSIVRPGRMRAMTLSA